VDIMIVFQDAPVSHRPADNTFFLFLENPPSQSGLTRRVTLDLSQLVHSTELQRVIDAPRDVGPSEQSTGSSTSPLVASQMTTVGSLQWRAHSDFLLPVGDLGVA